MSNGICTHCNIRPLCGKALCKECNDKIKQRKNRLKEQGLCVTCGKKPLYTTLNCKNCNDELNKWFNEKRKELIAKGLCETCGEKPLFSKRQCEECLLRNRENSKSRRAKQKKLVYKHYGNVCNCCGEAEPSFLSIDHINNDGKEHRTSCGNDIYRDIIKKGYPQDLQILCMNCQWGRKNNNGVCPHKANRKTFGSMRQMMHAKIHLATVTEANLYYIGSVTIDEDLLDVTGIIENERVQIVNVNTGARFETYVIVGERGSGVICLNGAAARKVQPGDKVIIIAYKMLEEDELRHFRPRIAFVDDHNKLTELAVKEPPKVMMKIGRIYD